MDAGGLAHIELPPGETSTAVTHRTIEEILAKAWDDETVVALDAGVCLTIPVGTQFQFRSFGHEPLAALGDTMPPWPGDGEAEVVARTWKPTVPRVGR